MYCSLRWPYININGFNGVCSQDDVQRARSETGSNEIKRILNGIKKMRGKRIMKEWNELK